MGFVQSHADPCIYLLEKKGDLVIVGVHVDDMLIAAKDVSALSEAKENIAKRFDVKDLGELKSFLGIQITQGVQHSMGQSGYVVKYCKSMAWQRPTRCQHLLIQTLS